MELEFFGGNCFKLKTKNTTIVVDDNLNKIGGKSIQNDKTVGFYTSNTIYDEKAARQSRLVIRTAGEFEVGDVTVTGLQTRSHTDTEEEQSATVLQFMYGTQTVTLLGHIHPDISHEVTELISGTDVLIVPVGGNGFTLDPTGAASLIKKAEPSIVIPSQYAIEGLTYEVPAQGLEEFAKVIPVNMDDVQDSLKLVKVAEDANSQAKVVVLKVTK